MAILHDLILGSVSGTVRNLTFKQRKDVNYLHTKPRKHKLPMDTGSVFRRKQFRFNGKLSKAIYDSPPLRFAWEKIKTKKTWCTYDDIFKANYTKFKHNNPDGIPVLFPGTCFKLNNPVVQKTLTGYNFNIGEIGFLQRFNLLNARSISVSGIFLYEDPDSPKPGENLNVESITTNVPIPDIHSPFSINIMLTGGIKTLFNSGSIKKAFFTLAFLNPNLRPVAFSEILIL